MVPGSAGAAVVGAVPSASTACSRPHGSPDSARPRSSSSKPCSVGIAGGGPGRRALGALRNPLRAAGRADDPAREHAVRAMRGAPTLLRPRVGPGLAPLRSPGTRAWTSCDSAIAGAIVTSRAPACGGAERRRPPMRVAAPNGDDLVDCLERDRRVAPVPTPPPGLLDDEAAAVGGVLFVRLVAAACSRPDAEPSTAVG